MVDGSLVEQKPGLEDVLLRQNANRLVQTAREFKIISVESRDAAVTFRRSIKQLGDRIANYFDPEIKAAHAAHKAKLNQKAMVDAPRKLADDIIGRKITDWEVAEQKRVEDERRRLQAEARQAEEERRLAEAAELEAAGYAEEAEAVIEEPIVTAPVHVEAPPKMEGSHLRTTWKHEVITPGLVPREWCMPDDKKLAAYARANREGASVPGVKFYPDHSTTTRRSGT